MSRSDIPPSRGHEVVTLGEVMALLLADPGRPLQTANGFELGFAGAEAKVAVGLARLGHRVAYVGHLGADPLGRRILGELRRHGVDTAGVRLLDDAPTGLLVRDAMQDRPTSVQYYRRHSAASRLAASDVPDEAIRSAAVLHVTGITAMLSVSARDAVARAVAVAREAGTLVSFDPNVRLTLGTPAQWREVVESLAPSADVVLSGVDDARVITDADPAAWFLDKGARHVVVKDGANGAWESDGDTTVHEPAHLVAAADTVGAGDAFAAGWLHGWLTGQDRPDRLRTAAAVAALCVGVRGDVPGLPDLETLRRVLARSDGPDVNR